MRARLKVEGLKEATTRLDAVGLRARRPEPALRARQTLADLTESQMRRFSQARGWKRISPRWVAQKRRQGLDPRVMRATGKLAHALTSGAGMTFNAHNAELRWGIPRGRSDLHYAQALAAGTSSTPARRMVVIDKTARASIAARVERYVTQGIVS